MAIKLFVLIALGIIVLGGIVAMIVAIAMHEKNKED